MSDLQSELYDLRAYRALVESWDDPIALALIDTAEAARAVIAFCNESGLLVGRREYVRLAASLACYAKEVEA